MIKIVIKKNKKNEFTHSCTKMKAIKLAFNKEACEHVHSFVKLKRSKTPTSIIATVTLRITEAMKQGKNTRERYKIPHKPQINKKQE